LHLRERAAELIGRRAECEVLNGLVEEVRAGASRSLVVSGEPGVGKTALMEYAVDRATRAIRARVLTLRHSGRSAGIR